MPEKTAYFYLDAVFHWEIQPLFFFGGGGGIQVFRGMVINIYININLYKSNNPGSASAVFRSVFLNNHQGAYAQCSASYEWHE